MSPPVGIAKRISLEGRVALVAGGGGGIGSAAASLLMDAGARVVCADLPGRDGPPGSLSIACDASDPHQVRALVERVRAEMGALHLLVHAVGITRDGVVWKLEDEDWRTVLRVNLDSAFFLVREVAPLMREAGTGSIVLVSSINGERGKFGQANYAASKAGLIGLGKTAARELGRFGIRVNVVAPGLVDTPMTASLPADVRAKAVEETALGRIATVEDVAGAVLFLSSSMSRHVTGQVLRVDGGQLMA
jgi:NAD(P)-dependent dehydrogenase (short-subunit alcohol dehydrogenase family)